MPAKVPNPRKQFLFTIFMPGLDPFLAQEVKQPDDEFDVAEHGDVGHDIKTAGKRKLSNLSVTKILPSTTLDTYMRNWRNRIRNFITGGGELPSTYKTAIIIEEYSADGITVLERHVYGGCWPQKVNGRDFSRKGSDNTVETLEFSVDEVF